MTTKASGSERFGTWLASGLVKRLRVQAALEGRSMRAIVEDAVGAYLEDHPVAVDDLTVGRRR